MPRRPEKIERDIPLFLIPHIVLRGVRDHGDELERVIVQKTSSHFYNVSIRTRPIRRELKKMKITAESPVPVHRGDGVERV